MRTTRLLAVILLGIGLSLGPHAVTPASQADARALATAVAGPRYAPLDRPGPRLSVPRAKLRAALTCEGNPRRGPRAVLLNPATSVTPEENYGWNWAKVFRRQGRYTCMVHMPHHTFGDIQTAAEYLVHAVRTMYRRTDRRIAILGHSQGGMSPRWALRFWPGLRPKVSEVIGMAPSNHGTTALKQCIEGVTECVPAVWQQAAGSRFIRALNSRAETFDGISYTNAYTDNDEVVTPPPSSGLTTGRGRIANIRIQDVCPTDPYEHNLVGTVSPAMYAVVMDALRHRGPARLSRIDRSWCTRPYMPGVEPTDLQNNAVPLLALPSLLSTALPNVTFSGAPLLEREPRLRCYVFAAGC